MTCLKKIVASRGSTVLPKRVIPEVGHQAPIRDPEGNVIGILENDPSARREGPVPIPFDVLTIRESLNVSERFSFFYAIGGYHDHVCLLLNTHSRVHPAAGYAYYQ